MSDDASLSNMPIQSTRECVGEASVAHPSTILHPSVRDKIGRLVCSDGLPGLREGSVPQGQELSSLRGK